MFLFTFLFGALLSIATDILNELGGISVGVLALIGDIIEGAVPLFYTAGVDPAPGTMTVMGVLLLIAAAWKISRWGIGAIRSMVGGSVKA